MVKWIAWLIFAGLLTGPVNAQEAETDDPWLDTIPPSLGTRFGDLTERVVITSSDEGENIPESLWVVMETRGSGYDLHRSDTIPKGVFGFRQEGWDRRAVMIRRGENPADIARQRYEKLAFVPACISSGLNVVSDIPQVFDTGPQVKILSVGPYRSLAALNEAEESGEFVLGQKWERVEGDTKEWEGWLCED